MPKEKVLIVDDEKDVLDLCKRILETQGYDVRTAGSGYEVIELTNREHFDLLLTDIKMPGMSGLEIAQILKQSDPGIICVTMTGFSTMDMAINAVKLGIDEFILKPFTPRDLNVAVTKALEKERLKKENFRLRSLIPLFELNKNLMRTTNELDLLDHLIEIASKETKANFVGLYIVDKDGQLVTRFDCTKSHYTKQNEVASNALAQETIEIGQQLVFNITEPELNHHNILKNLGSVSVISTPLKSQNANLGALVLAREESSFAPSDSEFLSVLCGQASIALENARLFTEIQEAYKQLKQLDHMKSEFINIAAHELRTPLAILMGYATVLEEEADDLQKNYLAHINRNAMRLRSLIDNMLNLQHLESGTVALTRDSVTLVEALQEVTQDISLLVKEKQIDINIDIPPDFPEMTIDREKFDLILMNLIHNAAKFTPPGGKINFRAANIDNQAHMALNNTGIVIPQEFLNRIFDRFYQIEHTLTREHGGAGLGLAIVRGMVEVCGGKISVESNEETGTTFTFMLPLDNSHLNNRRLIL
ncbi:MAG: response regulator [Anaerolineales bacterium]|nr:response regulator [Anaerolineales bacterium]